MTAEGEKDSVRLMIDGTREDGVLGIAPTGRTIEVAVLDLFEIRNDTLAEHWDLLDNVRMLRQLGVPSN